MADSHATSRSRRLAATDNAALVQLAYELLDAHDDTASLAAQVAADDDRWRVHLDYLRDLQRAGRELLARAHAGS